MRNEGTALHFRRSLIASIHSFVEPMVKAVADDVDMIQHLDEMAMHGRVAAIRSRTETTELPPAECDDCGNDIPLDRRRAVPWTRRCVRCQTLAERAFGGRA